MKKLFLLLFLLFCVSVYSQQSQFIIGADWLNSTATDWRNITLNNNYWNLIQSFGLNFGTLPLDEYSAQDVTNINTQLTNAYNHGIGIELNTYVIGNSVGWPQRRWMYQVESHYDFNNHNINQDAIDNVQTNGAETHWSMVKNPTQVPNYVQLSTSSYGAGLVAYGLINQNQIPDGANYYVKVRIRNRNGVTTHTPVVQVSVIGNGNTYSGIIYADQLGNNVWEEKTAFNFNKTASGPSAPTTQSTSTIVITDPLGITGVQDYIISPTPTYTSYDIQVYWYGQVDCDIDYVVVEDYASYNLNNGLYDNVITNDVNNFVNNPGLYKYKVRDEIQPEEFLTVRYENRKVQTVFNNNNHPEKNALAFNNQFVPTQQYLAQTELNQLRTDIYPITNTTPAPSYPDYLTSIQDIFNTQLIDRQNGLRENILTAIKFNKPCWFTPQTHSWENALREPSVYETKAMANFAVCYGAKGIQYFMFSIPHYSNSQSGAYGVTLLDNDDPNNPVPRYTDSYGNPKWATLQTLNNKLNTIGNTLISLTWQNGFSIHLGQPTGTIISNIQSSQNGIADGTTYAELGLFKETDQINNNNLDFFYIVNRRTLSSDQRDIAITINKSSSTFNNWEITEIGTSNTWSVSNTGAFTTSYQPGEGKLFRLEPVISFTTSGSLTADETWSGNITLTGNVTVPSGINLTIQPGTTVSAPDGFSLNIDGTLIADGGTFDFISSNFPTPNGIIVNRSGSVSISNSTIQNAYNGVSINTGSSQSSIQNSTIQNCNNGIVVEYGGKDADIIISGNSIQSWYYGICISNSGYGMNDQPVISGNQITGGNPYGMETYGIGLTNTSLTFENNSISSCSAGLLTYNDFSSYYNNSISDNSLYGVLFSGGSQSLFNNYLSNNGCGIFSTSSSTQLANYSHEGHGNNSISGGDVGIYAYGYSNIFLGTYDMANEYSLGGYNSITNASCLIDADYCSRVDAEYNYWGDPPYNFSADGTSWIDWSNPLSPSDLSMQSLTHVLKLPINELNIESPKVHSSYLSASNTGIPSNSQITGPVPYNQTRNFFTPEFDLASRKWSLQQKLLYVASVLRSAKRYVDAAKIYHRIIGINPSKKWASFALMNLYSIYKSAQLDSSLTGLLMTDELMNYCQSLIDTCKGKSIQTLAYLLLGGESVCKGKPLNAINYYNSLADLKNGEKNKLFSLWNLYNINHYLLKNEVSAKNSFDEMKAKYPDDELTSILASLTKHDNKGIASKLQSSGTANVTAILKDNSSPDKFVLSQNYPNPFNPTSTIEYALKEPSNVRLIVYNILGQEVAKLINEYQSDGYYSVQFSGSSLPSGVYVYEIQAKGNNGNLLFTDIKKMLLLK